tara:strand:+ start:30 stop:1403 length:1374 start_codon:yes stop_codon:yes gene_type:complete
MATTYLSRTPSSASNRKTWTWSGWLKRAVKSDSNNSRIFASGTGSSDYTSWYMYAPEGTDGTLQFQNRISGTTTSVALNRKFRDVNAWMHLVIAMDTTQANASDRMKIYVNGVQETSFSTFNPPAQNVDTWVNNNNSHTIGSSDTTGYTPRYWAGSMSHINFVDGTALTPSSFGSTDSTTGEWKINTAPNVTYGTNGYFILKDGNSVTDQSTNSNNWTVAGGTLTKTEDCPSNVFATLNPLDNYYANSTFSNGNTSQTSNAGAYGWVPSTLGMTTGKFYAECKQTGFSGGSNYNLIGITGSQNDASTHHLGQIAYTAGYYAQGNVYNQSGSTTSTYASYTTNDIIGVALDLDNNKLYFSKNGVWQNSGDPTSGATGTGALNITAPSAMTGATATGVYRFASGDYGNTVVVNNSWNFGNGYFGSTQISSAGTNASGIGIFEYDVPTGYTALSTKGLNL